MTETRIIHEQHVGPMEYSFPPYPRGSYTNSTWAPWSTPSLPIISPPLYSEELDSDE